MSPLDSFCVWGISPRTFTNTFTTDTSTQLHILGFDGHTIAVNGLVSWYPREEQLGRTPMPPVRLTYRILENVDQF